MTTPKQQQNEQQVPPTMKLWICCHCLSPRLYGSNPECYACGKRLHDTATYVHEDAATTGAVSIPDAISEVERMRDHWNEEARQAGRAFSDKANTAQRIIDRLRSLSPSVVNSDAADAKAVQIVNEWRGQQYAISQFLMQSPAAVADLCRMIAEAIAPPSVGVGTEDALNDKIDALRESYPNEQINLSITTDGYCYITRTSSDGYVRAIAEGATIGDAFDID